MGELIGRVPPDPAEWRRVHRRIVEELRQTAPAEFLARVPELAARARRSYAVLHTRRHARYFEPWKDEQGRVVAMRAYLGKRSKDGAKYKTSAGRWGPLVHFAFGCAPGSIDRVPWIFTEGWMKAEVAAHHLGGVGVAFAGVNQRSAWPRALEAKQRLAPDAPAYVAFDAEIWLTRLDLAVPTLRLARALQAATGHRAGFAVWDAVERDDGPVESKGIDDAIVSGTQIHLVDRHVFAASLGPLLERWEVARAA